jgi:hypothetical protein
MNIKVESPSLFLDYLLLSIFAFLVDLLKTSKMIKYQFPIGTDHAIPHLYDINTFQCYLSANIPDANPNGAINQACQFSPVPKLSVTSILLLSVLA